MTQIKLNPHNHFKCFANNGSYNGWYLAYIGETLVTYANFLFTHYWGVKISKKPKIKILSL